MGSKLGNVGSCAKMCLRWLNIALVMAASASVAIVLLLRRWPTTMGWAFIAVSGVSIFSGILGFSSQANRPYFVLQSVIVLVSVIGQGLGFLVLFFRREETLRRLRPSKNERETQILIRANAGLLAVMFCVQMWVLVLACGLQYCVSEDYQGLDFEPKEGISGRRSRRLARVQEESVAQVTVTEELHAHELNNKMKEKYGQWAGEAEFDP